MKGLIFEFSFQFGTTEQYFIVDVYAGCVEDAVCAMNDAALDQRVFIDGDRSHGIKRVVIQPAADITEAHLTAIYGPIDYDNEDPRGWTIEEFKNR